MCFRRYSFFYKEDSSFFFCLNTFIISLPVKNTKRIFFISPPVLIIASLCIEVYQGNDLQCSLSTIIKYGVNIGSRSGDKGSRTPRGGTTWHSTRKKNFIMSTHKHLESIWGLIFGFYIVLLYVLNFLYSFVICIKSLNFLKIFCGFICHLISVFEMKEICVLRA